MDAELWVIVQAWDDKPLRTGTLASDPDVELHLGNGEALACHSHVLSRASPDVLAKAIAAQRRQDPCGRMTVRLYRPRLVKCCVFEVLRQVYTSAPPSTISTYRWYLNLAKTYAALGIQMPDHKVSSGRRGASVRIMRDGMDDSWLLCAASGLSWDTLAPLSLEARLSRAEASDDEDQALDLVEQDAQSLNAMFGLPLVKTLRVLGSAGDSWHRVAINGVDHAAPSPNEDGSRDITQIVMRAIRHCLLPPEPNSSP
ncbi:hypothetical protein ml_232 [Mollivirus sibericum]|uniref:hypothetical protein n=1 Tax=Mollivirus sibericum TaxID=1678078 RepID=UPI0006B2DD2A|nr:hypothetical protein ml_232 [Mollivirus sibericum]ALD62034.1 hypothetical protein ml_232 [Mollivirus sibericum]